MATPSEIIMSRDRRGLPVSERVHNVVDTTGGLTDELYNTEIMRTLGKTAPAYLEESEWDGEPIVPDLKSVLSKLGVKAEDDPTGVKAARKFVEEFPKKREAWKSKVEKDPAFGTRGWATVQDLFKQTSIDLMNYDIAENRRKIASGEDAKGFDWLRTKAANIVAPRVVKAVSEGRDPTPSEVIRDIGANAAYGVPFGSFARAASIGRPITSKVLGLAGQAAAPSVVAASDIIADPEYTGEDFAADVALGTLTNLGVNRYIAPRIGKALATSQSRISSRVPKAIKDALQDNPTAKDAAYELLDQAKRTAEAPVLAKDAVASLAEGKLPVTPEARAKASDILAIGDAAGHTYNFGKKGLAAPGMYRLVLEAGNPPADKATDLLGTMVAGTKIPPAAVALDDKAATDALVSKVLDEGKRYSATIKEHPELASLFFPTPLNISPTNVLKTYAINQYGSATPGVVGMAAGAVGGDAKKIQESVKASKAEKAHKEAVSEILGGGNLTAEDYRYLEKLKDNPKMLKFSQDEGFKTWLLKRGHRLLQGTPAHRPLWEAE